MRLDLKPTSKRGLHGVFDPAAMLHVINDPHLERLSEDDLEEEAGKGNILVCPWERASLTLRVFLDEEPPEAFRAKATHKEDRFLLRVPSGTLVAVGLEHVCRPGAEPVTAEQFETLIARVGETARIPAGDYVVEVLAIEGEEWAPGPLDRVFSGLSKLGCALSALGAVAMLVVLLASLVLGKDWFRALGLGVTVLAGFWLLLLSTQWLSAKLSAGRRLVRQEEQRWNEFPFHAALVFRAMDKGGTLRFLKAVAASAGIDLRDLPEPEEGTEAMRPVRRRRARKPRRNR